MSMSVLKKSLSLMGVIVALVGISGTARASAAEPWWHMSVSTRASTITPGAAQSEVQEIVLSPEVLFQLKAAGKTVGEFASKPYTSIFAPEATAANVQKTLEGVYGAGNVEVSGGVEVPGGPAAALVVKSVHEDIYESVAALTASATRGTAEGKVVTAGRPDGTIVLFASNLGEAPANGSQAPVKISDALPPGLKAVGVKGTVGTLEFGGAKPNRALLNCQLEPEAGKVEPTCTWEGTALAPYDVIEVEIPVLAQAGATNGEVDTASVEGGGAPSAAKGSMKLAFGDEAPFGLQDYELTPEARGGGPVTQAGAHPFQLTTTVTLDQTAAGEPTVLPKDLNFRLPPGLVGNPTAYPRCTMDQFLALTNFENECRPETALGVVNLTYTLTGARELIPAPLFNLEPEKGEPARFGFVVHGIVPVVLDTSVRTGGDYGVTVSAHNIDQFVGFLSSQVTFWGVPGSPAHDSARGWQCMLRGHEEEQFFNEGHDDAELNQLHPCNALEETNPAPFLSLPTHCSGEPLTSAVDGDPWVSPGGFETFPLTAPLPTLDGCNQLRFEPSIQVAPDGSAGSTPTGLTVGIHVPQDLQLNPNGTAQSNVKDTTVTLPEGMTLNPGGADGLEACSEAQIGFLGKEAGEPATNLFTSGLPNPFCPDGAKIATVSIKTPLLPNPLEGFVYLASQEANPFGSLIAMYIEAEDPVSGTLVKLPGEVSLDQSTGRITSTFKNTPQLPFEDLTLHFFGGSRAPLSTPPLCGSYETRASFTPWSGNGPVDKSTHFSIDSGPGGGPCSSPRLFAPDFQAGSTNIQAGAFTPFTTTMSRPDASQPLGRLSMKLPPGLLGTLSSVKLCPEPQASLGACGPESLIGHTVVAAGLGPNPVIVKHPGDVYITGPYEGAPYGLSIVNPAEAGPFNLGNVIVRARIEVDPLTAALTVASDPLPTILKGIPLQLQHVNVTIDRSGFAFNPTNCGHMAIGGTISSSEGASAPLSTPFQVTNCATLGFKPTFKASTNGRTSRKNGASLDVKLTYPRGAFGKDANIRSVKVNLPKQLPSRLTTLQKACPDRTFNANPAACPAASRVGSATAITPVIPVPLSGPAYFVSHGGAKFPELVIVVSGYGTTVQLHGETFISKKGITSSTFRQVPDVPVGSFELKLPQGANSALAANGNLCKVKGGLKMPTAFTAQNGAVIHRSTPIGVTGCPRTRKKKARR